MSYINVDDQLFKLTKPPISLSYAEVVLLSYISSMEKFYATNDYIADVMQTSPRTIKRWLAKLKSADLISIYYEKVYGVERRIIVPNLAH